MAVFIFFVFVIFTCALFISFPYLSRIGDKVEKQTIQKQITDDEPKVIDIRGQKTGGYLDEQKINNRN